MVLQSMLKPGFDPKTGEVMTTKQKPVFDEAKLKEEENLMVTMPL